MDKDYTAIQKSENIRKKQLAEENAKMSSFFSEKIKKYGPTILLVLFFAALAIFGFSLFYVGFDAIKTFLFSNALEIGRTALWLGSALATGVAYKLVENKIKTIRNNGKIKKIENRQLERQKEPSLLDLKKCLKEIRDGVEGKKIKVTKFGRLLGKGTSKGEELNRSNIDKRNIKGIKEDIKARIEELRKTAGNAGNASNEKEIRELEELAKKVDRAINLSKGLGFQATTLKTNLNFGTIETNVDKKLADIQAGVQEVIKGQANAPTAGTPPPPYNQQKYIEQQKTITSMEAMIKKLTEEMEAIKKEKEKEKGKGEGKGTASSSPLVVLGGGTGETPTNISVASGEKVDKTPTPPLL